MMGALLDAVQVLVALAVFVAGSSRITEGLTAEGSTVLQVKPRICLCDMFLGLQPGNETAPSMCSARACVWHQDWKTATAQVLVWLRKS